MFSGHTCDAPWARLSPGRELGNLLEDVLQAGIAEACPDRSAELAESPNGVKDAIAAQLDAGNLAELVNACHRQIARLQVLELAAQVEFRRRRRADDCWEPHMSSEIDRFITSELSAATAISPASLDVSLAVGRDLQDRLPEVREAMLNGDADFAKAKAIGELTRLIEDPGILDAAQERAVEWARNNTSTRLRHNLRKLVKKLDPDAVQERKRRSVAMRSLQLWANDDETATLAGVNLEPALAERAYERVNQLAKARRSAGDERTLDNLRADILVGLILGDISPGPGGSSPGGGSGGGNGDSGGGNALGSNGAPCGSGEQGDGGGDESSSGETDRADADTDTDADTDADTEADADADDTETADTATGADGEYEPPAQHGAGERATGGEPAATAAARSAAHVLSQLAPGTSAAAIAAHALRLREQAGEFPGCVTGVLPDGTLVHGNPTYRPPGSMQVKIRERDLTCRYPNCNRKAKGCDIDHGIPYDRDGPTCTCNLHAICRGHHRQKALPGWHLIDIYPGVICWIASSGHWYITTPGIEAD